MKDKYELLEFGNRIWKYMYVLEDNIPIISCVGHQKVPFSPVKNGWSISIKLGDSFIQTRQMQGKKAVRKYLQGIVDQRNKMVAAEKTKQSFKLKEVA